MRVATVSSWILAALMAVESLLGLVVTGLFPEEPWAIAALRGNDLITLVLVTPALVLALLFAKRSDRWALVWLGALIYSVYNFAYYAFGTAFNDVFLLHVASFSLAIVALIGFVADFDARGLAEGIGAMPGRRAAAGLMIVIGLVMLGAWGALSVRFALTGELPEDVMPPSAVHLVYALDMSLLAPSFLAGGIMLWRRLPWGYALGAAVNLFGAAYLIVLEFVGGFQANEGIADKTWISPPALGGALLCALAAWVVLGAIGRVAVQDAP